MSPPPEIDESDDWILFEDAEEPRAADAAAVNTWTVVVVDDDQGVHQITRLVLEGFKADRLPVVLVHAHSAAEAQATLRAHPECALVLLDVVMETDNAGLQLVEWIRNDLRNNLVRVVLRTGQPGVAPEEEVMDRYDIHDYCSKTEMSARRLRTTVTGGIRAYKDLRTVSLQRQALEKVIAATGTLFAPRTLERLLTGILEQVSALLFPRENAIFFLSRPPLFAPTAPEPHVLAASGRFAAFAGSPVSSVLPAERFRNLESTVIPGQWSYIDDDGLFGFDIGESTIPALYIENAVSLSDWERQTIALFCSSAAMALRNQRLYLEREDLLSAFARFVPSEFLNLLGKRDVRTLSVGDQRVRELSVCFLDVQGFTQRSEALGPAKIFSLLNRIYGAIGPVVAQYGGVIDKYMGDGVMVLFPSGPQTALDAAVGIQEILRQFNREPDVAGDPVVVRSSIEHGQVILGTVGHAGRFDTTVIADVANVAARLQGWCRTLDVDLLVTANCLDHANCADQRALGSVAIRGRREPVEVVEVFATDPPARREAKRASAENIARAVACRRAGEWSAAIAALEEALAVLPDDGPALWMRADCTQQTLLASTRSSSNDALNGEVSR